MELSLSLLPESSALFPVSAFDRRRKIFRLPNPRRSFCHKATAISAVTSNNSSVTTTSSIGNDVRLGEVLRVTNETNVSVRINLDGSGVADSSTGIPFLDHMLDACRGRRVVVGCD